MNHRWNKDLEVKNETVESQENIKFLRETPGIGKTFLSNSQKPQAMEEKINKADGCKCNKQNQNIEDKVRGNYSYVRNGSFP